jgi:hypothetical protein
VAQVGPWRHLAFGRAGGSVADCDRPSVLLVARMLRGIAGEHETGREAPPDASAVPYSTSYLLAHYLQ